MLMIPVAEGPLPRLVALEATVHQLLQELPQLIRASHVWEVQQRLTRCLWQTQTQATRLEQAVITLGAARIAVEGTHWRRCYRKRLQS